MPFLFNVIGFFFTLIGASGRLLLSRVVAFLVFDLLRVRRQLVMKNLERVFGSDSSRLVRTRIARTSVVNFVLTSIEFFCARWIFKRQTFEFQNAETLDQALAKGRGVYALVIHSGNFEMMAYAVSRRFRRVFAPVKPVGRGSLAQWVQHNRAEHGLVEIVQDDSSEKSRTGRLVEALNQNEIVGFMVDQRRKKGLLVPFFGELAWTNSGLFYLWKAHPAPVVPITIQRTGLRSHRVTVHHELDVFGVGELKFKEFVLENTKRMNQRVEALVAANPSEYFWMHDRWKK